MPRIATPHWEGFYLTMTADYPIVTSDPESWPHDPVAWWVELMGTSWSEADKVGSEPGIDRYFLFGAFLGSALFVGFLPCG